MGFDRGNQWWWCDYTTATTNTVEWFDHNSKVVVAPVQVNVNVQQPEPKTFDPLEWLREQVAEICELAYAA